MRLKVEIEVETSNAESSHDERTSKRLSMGQETMEGRWYIHRCYTFINDCTRSSVPVSVGKLRICGEEPG